MATDDFFRARLDQMIDLRHPLAVLAGRIPWTTLESSLAPSLAHRDRKGRVIEGQGLFGPTLELAGAGVSAAGRPRLPIRLMASLLYLKHAFNLSDEAVVERWSENVVWQFFSGREYYEPKAPCDATQIGRFRTAIGEAGVEEILKATIDTAVKTGAVPPEDFQRVIVDSTVQEKAIAFPTESRLLEIARHKVVGVARAAGVALKQTFANEGKQLRRRAGGYAHAKQYRRLKRILRRQRTILGRLIREVRRKWQPQTLATETAGRLTSLLERCDQLRTQPRRGKDKVYALHAPEVECISKGKARHRYEFGVKASLAVTHRSGLIVGARTFPGNPYDGHVLGQQLEQTTILLEDVGVVPEEVFVDLGYRGVDADNPGVRIVHRGRMKTLDDEDRQRLKRRQAIEPVIGHLKADHRMARCWLKGAKGDALNAVLAAAGFNLRWLMRAVLAGRISAFLRALRLSTANGSGTAAAFITRILASTALATVPSPRHAGARTALTVV